MRQRRLRLLVSGVCAAGATVLVACLVLQVLLAEPVALWRLVVVGVVVVLAEKPVLHVRWGRQDESLNWSEVALVLAVALLPAPTAVLIAAAGALAAHGLSGNRPVNLAFNTSVGLLGVGLVAGVVALATGTSPWDRPAALDLGAGLVLVGAVAVAAALDLVVAGAAIAWSSGQPWAAVVRRGLGLRALLSLGNATATTGLLILVPTSPLSAALVLPLLAFGHAAYSNHLRVLLERDVWRQLEEASAELNQLSEPVVAATALGRLQRLFDASRSALVVEVGEGEPRTYTSTADDADVAAQVTVELRGPAERIGELHLGLPEARQLTDRELQVLRAYAASVGASLQNAAMHSELARRAERSAHEAQHDALTGLANRARLHAEAPDALARARTDGTVVALLLVDLDHFKQINDTLGHAAGDQLLAAVARRLDRAVGRRGLVARLGGDEFAVLLPDLPDETAAEVRARELLEVLASPAPLGGVRLSVEGSMGVACFPADGEDVEELVRCADVAMYEAKGSRGSAVRYAPDRDANNLDSLSLAADLRHAVTSDQLVLHYQPQVDAWTGHVEAVEALVRWQHPDRGLLPPQVFVPLAEHSGLVQPFMLWVLDHAVRDLADLRRGHPGLRMAVNLSARCLLDDRLPGDVEAVLARHRVPPDAVVLEITETVTMSELDVVPQVLAELRRRRVQVSVDDFGTGYSSLSVLQRIVVDEVKVDKSFVLRMTASTSDGAIVRSVAALAEQLGVRSVAEGVETADLLHSAREAGCGTVQGYFVARPLPLEELRGWLSRGPRPGAALDDAAPWPGPRRAVVLAPGAPGASGPPGATVPPPVRSHADPDASERGIARKRTR